MNNKRTGTLIIFAALFIAASYQDKKKATEKEIETAITKGVKWLKGAYEASVKGDDKNKVASHSMISQGHELILYTFIHADLNEKDETFKKLLEKVLSTKPEQKRTYNVAVEIMALVSLDPAKYQDRIAHCVQVLVDGQLYNGGWGYGPSGMKNPKDIETDDKKTPTTHDKKGSLKEIIIKKQKKATDKMARCDNSNSQYAALGLRAAFEANVKVEKEVLQLARQYYEKCQNDDGGWEYSFRDNTEKNKTQFHDPKKTTSVRKEQSYGSMTVGGLAALAGYKFMLKEDYKKDKCVQKAVEWVSKNFAVDKNPNPQIPSGHYHYHYYYLYGLERAAAMSDVMKFGSHDWYQEGAYYLVKHQQEDGHWSGDKDKATNGLDKKNPRIKPGPVQQNDYWAPIDTCFAILFLRRATEHLLETGR